MIADVVFWRRIAGLMFVLGMSTWAPARSQSELRCSRSGDGGIQIFL